MSKANRAAAVMREWLSNDGLTPNAHISLESLIDGAEATLLKDGAPQKEKFRRFMRAMLGTAFQIGRHTPSKCKI